MTVTKDNRLTFGIIFLVLLLGWGLYHSLFDVGMYDEDDWYHLHFGKRIVQKGFLEADIFGMLVTSPEFSTEEVRMIFMLQLWWAQNYDWWGAQAKGHHISAFFLLLFCALLIFNITKRLTKNDRAAIIAMLLFLVYPFNVRVIGNATAVVYVLLTFFFLASIACYLGFLRAKKLVRFSKIRTIAYYLLSVFFFLLAALTQESAYGLPIMLLFMDIIVSSSQPRLKIKKPIYRALPFFVILLGLVSFTIWLAFKYNRSSNLEGRFLDFIGFPIWKYITVIPEGFLMPFYKGMEASTLLGIGSACAVIVIASVGLFLFRKQNKQVLLFGITWIVVTSLPILQVLSRVVFPDEAEEKYLFLPMVGFCILIGQLANPREKQSPKLRNISVISLFALVVFFSFGTLSNGSYYRDLGDRYQKTLSGLEQRADKAKADATITMLYGDHQTRRELMLAAFLEYTFDFPDKRPWFFIDKGQLLGVRNGLLPDLTISAPTLKITDETGLTTQRRGLLKRPAEFKPIMLPYDKDTLILGFDTSDHLVDLGKDLVPILNSRSAPLFIDLAQYERYGQTAQAKYSYPAMPAQSWVLMGNVYRVFPVIGRF